MSISNPAAQPWAVEVCGLTKTFNERRVLKGLDMKVKEGEAVVIFGPNGAGKTTLIKILATLLKPSFGSVHMAGLDLHRDPAAIRHKIGLVSHQTFLYDDLTVIENLRFYGKMYDVPDLERRIHDLISRVGLTAYSNQQVRTLSRGTQQRLSIARAVIHEPRIMLLDEPETGLDQSAMAMLQEMLDALNLTTLMTTHSLEYGLRMCKHVVILSEGSIAYEEPNYCDDVNSLRDAYNRFTGARR